MDTILSVKNLTKKYGSNLVLDDVSLTLKEGEIVGLIGANGSGKTTFMKVLVNLVKKNSGDIFLKNSSKELNEDIGTMLESPHFYNYLSGMENLRQVANNFKKKISNEKLEEIFKFVELDNLKNKKVATYSLGQRQSLYFAQALVNSPKLLLLDEPINGLDANEKNKIRKKIQRLSEQGIAVVISSHILSEVEKVVDRVCILKAGKIIEKDNINKTTKTYKIILGNNNLVENILKKLNIANYIEKDSEIIIENIERELKKELVEELVEKGQPIKYISEETKNLEQLYFNALEGENND